MRIPFLTTTQNRKDVGQTLGFTEKIHESLGPMLNCSYSQMSHTTNFVARKILDQWMIVAPPCRVTLLSNAEGTLGARGFGGRLWQLSSVCPSGLRFGHQYQ